MVYYVDFIVVHNNVVVAAVVVVNDDKICVLFSAFAWLCC